MKQEILKIIEHFSERKAINKQTKVSIFFICFTISLFIWFLIKMSQDYTSELKFPLAYSNPPNGLIHTNTYDSVLTVKVTARGFDLLSLLFFNTPEAVSINLAENPIKRDRYSMSSYITSTMIRNQLVEQIDFTDRVLDISPDTLKFDLEQIINKEVKVVGDINFTTKAQYQLYGEISIFPEKIFLSGPPSALDTLNTIYTKNTKFNNIDENIETRIALLKPGNQKIKLSEDSVSVTIPVEKFTENIARIPIQINNAEKESIKLFPDLVEVKYLIALKDFSHFQNDMLSVGINFDKTKNRQTIEVLHQPAFIKITGIQPQSVEYIIIK